MRPLPPAPFLPDAAEVIQRAVEEGIRQGMALFKKAEEEARAKINRERDKSPDRLFVAQDDEPKTSTRAATTTLSSGPYAGLQSAKKRAHETVDPGEKSTSSFGPAKKILKKGNALKNVKMIDSRTMTKGPDWYNTVDLKERFARGDMQDLKFLFTLITNATKDAADGKHMAPSLSKIRIRVQQMEFFTSLSPILVKKSGLLDHEGLPLIFENRAPGVWFPVDIRADADILFRKWMSGQIDPHLYRGLVTKAGTTKEDKSNKSHSLDPDFAGRVSCNYVGAGNLVNGQWWPLQLCAKRDGAHGEIEAGIHGQKGKGAFSVVISGGGYTNVDNGSTVKYCGTQGSENMPSAGTKLMLEANENKQSIRVLRSASMPAGEAYRPSQGFRYDGLYGITDYEILDERTAMYRFTLLRHGGQAPIRYRDEGQIPSDTQILELHKIRERMR